jgi:hypothetical protein
VSAATTAAEWLQMVSLAAGLYAAVSSPYFLLVDAEVWAWPRPLVGAVGRVHCSLKSGRLAPVWQPVVHAGRDLDWAFASGQHYVGEFTRDVRSFARLSLREHALTVAALLLLLTITPGDAR